jgi:hypothetical protein
MKKKMNVMEIMLEICLVFIVMILSASLFAEEQPVEPLSEQVMKLKKKLILDETQTAKVREILEKDRAQAVQDRETFKENAISLIQVAYDRRKTTNMHIESLLNPDQKEIFKEIVEMTRFDRDLFELTEGLCLKDEQAFTVEGILIDYYNAVKEIIPEEMRSEGEDERSGRFGPMTPPTGMRGFGLLRDVIKRQEKKKNKAIKKILFNHQKELFVQIKKDRKKKMKERREKMKERMKERGERYYL